MAYSESSKLRETFMPIDRTKLTEEQKEALELALTKINIAQKEAAEILTRAGMPHELPTSHCTGTLPGNIRCPCMQFMGGDENSCSHVITIVTGDVPFDVYCGHPRSKHLEA